MPAPAPSPTAKLSAGDPAMRDGPPENVPLEREAIDNRRYLRGSAWGQIVWSGRLVVGGTHDAPSITVAPFEAITLRDSDGVWRPYFRDAEATVGAAAVEGGGDLAANEWYYLYAHDAGGTQNAQFQLSLTPPTASLAWKDAAGTALYRYLGCFPTDGAGDPLPLHAVRGNYLYTLPPAVGSYSAADTLVSLAGRLPPHTRHAICRASVTRGSGTGAILGHVIEPPADVGSPVSRRAWGVALASVAEGDTVNGTFEVLTDSSRQVRVVAGGSASPLVLAVAGFRE